MMREIETLSVTCREAEVLREAAEILIRVQLDFGGKNTIVSVETGECICPNELGRARGILSFCASYSAVTINS